MPSFEKTACENCLQSCITSTTRPQNDILWWHHAVEEPIILVSVSSSENKRPHCRIETFSGANEVMMFHAAADEGSEPETNFDTQQVANYSTV